VNEYSDIINKVVMRMNPAGMENEPVLDSQSSISRTEIAKLIDHTLLKPDAVESDIVKICEEANKYGFASVCINSYWVKFCLEHVSNPEVKVCGVAGFPLGANSLVAKAVEAYKCVEDGAGEVDMVMNIGAAKQGEWGIVERDISGAVNAISGGALLKVIIECCLLTDEEKVKACLCAQNAGADFVKTSTGFSKWGAVATDVVLMRRVIGANMGIKAAGGIRNMVTLKLMLKAGANRIGTSSGVAIIEEET